METFINSSGIKMCRIEPGTFRMGSDGSGERDESPAHRVALTKPFAMGAVPVTNAQYELFDCGHHDLRGKRGFSRRDDEPALFVSYEDACNFCKWLSRKENKPYRLPTEAEWEYCCRAGTRTAYSTGDTLPESYFREQRDQREIVPVDLTVGRSPANAFGLCDMHGLAEEWCLDWYGPYPQGEQADPAGPGGGTCRVTRGGSHNTDAKFLTSSQRMAALPEERSCRIGFRVVQGEAPENFLPEARSVKQWQKNVSQEKCVWSGTAAPFFDEPIPYILTPGHPSEVPFYPHNHCPSITWCGNGDLLAVWFSCRRESGREMTILASRLRRGGSRWDPPAEFYKIPDRNMSGSSLFNDGRGTLYHLNGVSSGYDWAHLALTVRTSRDNGVTWSRPAYADPEHGYGNQAISGTIETRSGTLLQPCDATPLGEGGTVLHESRDGGKTWRVLSGGGASPYFAAGSRGSRIAGIHAGVAELDDGSLLAFGRGNSLKGRMPQSLSSDGGATWRYSASEFPPIANGQRLVLKKLIEGPLLLISFSDNTAYKFEAGGKPEFQGIEAVNAFGKKARVFGMFAALSYDGGKSWPVKRLLSSGARRKADGGAWTGAFESDENHAEPMGYLAAAQTPDGTIHLVSSRLYYRFNLAWLENAMAIG